MTDFETALKQLPDGTGFDSFAHKTVEDLCWICLHELDLVAEREYWAPVAKRKKFLKFIEKFGPSCATDYTEEARKVYAQAQSVQPSECYTNDY